MPTYQYRCKECEHQLEVVQSFTDEPLAECPQCGGALRKMYGSVGISFKGSGFYKTDSRSKPTKSSSGGSSGDSTSTSSTDSSSSKADSKTESKTEKAPASTSSSSSD